MSWRFEQIHGLDNMVVQGVCLWYNFFEVMKICINQISPLRVVVIGLAIVMCLGDTPAVSADFNSWTHKMKITFCGYNHPGGAETLTNFPALAVLSTNIAEFRYTDFNSASNGADLRFAASNTTTELNYEIEKWDTNGSSYVWVQVPEIMDTNSYIFAYWGHSASSPAYTTNGATWESDYKAVWHMKESNALDSTSNANNGTSWFGETSTNTGIIDGCGSFDGVDDCILTTTNINGQLSQGFTLEAWAYSTNFAGVQTLMANYDGNNLTFGMTDGLQLRANLNDVYIVYTDSNGANYIGRSTTTDVLTDNAWHYVVATWTGVLNNASFRVYVDGTRCDQANFSGGVVDSWDVSTRNFEIGRAVWGGGAAGWMKGLLDEERISSVARSSNHIWVAWMNVVSNSTFNRYEVQPSETSGMIVIFE